MILNTKLILEYNHFFQSEPPVSRLELIKNIPKKNLIIEIAGLNYRLKTFKKLKYDFSIEAQYREIERFCPIDKGLQNHYLTIFNSFVSSKNFPLIFNRATNLFALEEIISSDIFIPDDEKFSMNNPAVWNAILKYLLAVNTEVVKFINIPNEELTLEKVSASAISLNELMIEDNPINTVFRGIKLIQYLSNHAVYGPEINQYFKDILKIDKDKFIYTILSLCGGNEKPNYELEFIYNHKDIEPILDFFSGSSIINRDPIKLLNIKKNPFYKFAEETHILLDINFLVNKTYNFLLNDFWFDYLKPQKDEMGNEIYNYKHYRSAFGLFFEDYIREIITNSFDYLKHPGPLLFDKLKIPGPDGDIEVADIYIRQNKKVLVGQVKSSSIYDKEKFSGDIDILYRNNREQFFKDFGVDQTLASIKTVLRHSKLFDVRLNPDKRIDFYPLVIVNDKIFQTPLLPHLLHTRFQELLESEDLTPHIIHPLVVMNVADIEYLENSLAKKKTTIWNIMKLHYRKFGKSIMPPFIITADRFITPECITKRVTEPMCKIINTYADQKSDKK
jgi:hypothetical protein